MSLSAPEFVGCELQVLSDLHRPAAVEALRTASPLPFLVLNTCQRLECYGFSVPRLECVSVVRQHRESEAFERIARIAAGLESRVLGELEVLGQVREAYKTFRESGAALSSRLDRIFQDALSAAREARKESGVDANMTSLSGLAARILMERTPAKTPVCVVGAGSLASSAARYLRNRGNFPLRVSSRCPQNAMQLASELGGFSSGLDNLAHLFESVGGILSATAAPHALIYPQHLERAARPLVVVDLGVPPDCDPGVTRLDGVSYIPLAEVEARAQINTDERRRRAQRAEEIIHARAEEWSARRGAR